MRFVFRASLGGIRSGECDLTLDDRSKQRHLQFCRDALLSRKARGGLFRRAARINGYGALYAKERSGISCRFKNSAAAEKKEKIGW